MNKVRTIFDSFRVFLALWILGILLMLVSFGFAVLLHGAASFVVDIASGRL